MLDQPGRAATAAESARGGAPLFVIARRCGRLANRLVLFANFIALAAERGYRVVNPTFHSYATLFESTRHDIHCQYPVANRRSLVDRVPGTASIIRGTRIFFHVARAASALNERFPVRRGRIVTLREIAGRATTDLNGPEIAAKLRDARIVLVNGWTFRAHGLTKLHGEEIREYFRPMPTLAEASREPVKRLRRESDIVVGVHIRRGDYATWQKGRFFFEVPRYLAWMRQLADQFPARRLAYFVSSDAPLDVAAFPGLRVGFGGGHPVSDLYGLAECDYVLGPPSTFSQWASFYGDKPLLHLYDKAASAERERFVVSDLCEIPGRRSR